MNKTKCLIWGGYGMGNVGDELTLAVAIRAIRGRWRDDFAILSPVPGYTRALFPRENVQGVQVVRNEPRSRFGALLKKLGGGALPGEIYPLGQQLTTEASRSWAEAIRDSELLYLAGGGYLTDLFDLELALLPVRLARRYGVPVETAPLGIGPFRKPGSLQRFQSAFQGVRLTVRDSESARICRELSLEATLQVDDGFRVADVVEGMRIAEPGTRVGVNLFPQYGDPDPRRTLDWWKELFVLLRKQETLLEGFSFHNQIRSDFAHTSECLAAAGTPPTATRPPDFDFRDACRYVAGLRAVVTSRFHAVVVANACGVPAIAVASGDYYGTKMTAACESFSTSRVVHPGITDPSEVATAIADLYR